MSRPNKLFALRLLRLFCPPHLLEEIEGDLMQRYREDIDSVGEKKANRRLLWNSIRYFRLGIVMRNSFGYRDNRLGLTGNYLKTSIRHIRKSKLNFAFKTGGLSLAIFGCLAIIIYVSFQLSFDTYHADYHNIYRINSQRKENGVLEQYAIIPHSLGPILKQQIPEISSIARIQYPGGHNYLRFNGEHFGSEGLIEADSSLFDVLTCKFITGDKKSLQKPNAIVLTRSIAEKIFGTTDVLQQVLGSNNDTILHEVTAVIEDTPPNSHIFFSAIVPIKEIQDFSLSAVLDPVTFVDQSATTYARLSGKPDHDLENKIEATLDSYVPKSERAEQGFDISFQPIADIYLGPRYRYDLFNAGSPVYVYIFSLLALMLLIVAGINYINLTLADFSHRARETGVRTVLGARKHHLIIQTTIDSIIIGALALATALSSLYLLFPRITMILDPALQFNMVTNPDVLIKLIPSLLCLLFFSSYFPARQFTKSGVIDNLKGKNASYNSTLSQTLLVTQFTISIICICTTLVAARQIGFIQNKDLGFDKRNLLVLSLPREFTVNKMVSLKQELRSIPGVSNVSNSSFRLSGGYWKDWYFVEEEGTQAMKNIELYEVFSDDALFETLRIKLIEGRLFDDSVPYDSGAAFVVNETLVKEMGWTNPIGKRIYTHPEEKGKWDGTVVGVVSDINISSLYYKVNPLVMRLPWTNEYPDGFVYIRYDRDIKTIVKSIRKVYNDLMPGYPFNYRFIDELYDDRYKTETKIYSSLQLGTLVVVIVSLLGIFSMAAYISVTRMKEFGIRKVLGATQSNIVALHLGFFTRLVLISNFLAFPLAYWLTKEWLDTFAYRIDITALPFAMGAVASVLMTFISGGFEAWKASKMNPVDAIKIEQ